MQTLFRLFFGEEPGSLQLLGYVQEPSAGVFSLAKAGSTDQGSPKSESLQTALLSSACKKIFTIEEAVKILDFTVTTYFDKFTIYRLLMSKENSSNEEKNIIVQIERPQQIKPLNKALFQKKI